MLRLAGFIRGASAASMVLAEEIYKPVLTNHKLLKLIGAYTSYALGAITDGAATF